MKINEIKYGRKFNLGNYESEEIAVGAAVAEEESPSKVLNDMMEFVNTKGKSAPAQSSKQSPSESAQAEASTKVDTPAAPAKPAKAPKKEKPVEKAAEPEVKAEEKKAEEPAAPKKEVPEDRKAAMDKSARGNTKYNRELEIHRKIFAELLDSNVPDWKKESAKAKKTSVEMDGEDFLDKEGKLVQSFREACIQKMK